MRSELHAFSRVEHAGTPTTPAVVVGVGVDIDHRCSVHRRIGSRIGNVASQLWSRARSQSDGSADANVATRAIPGGFRCQRSRRAVAHPPFADERSKLIVVTLPNVTFKDECVAIEEFATRRSRQHVHLGCVKSFENF